MYGCKLGMELNKDISLSFADQIRLYKNVGFEGFFAYWQYGLDVAELRRVADDESMYFQSLHAPAGAPARHLWYQSAETATSLQIFRDCLRACADNGVPIMVMHSFYGFDLHEPTLFGLENYSIIANEARSLGVRLALENLEGEEYLAALLAHFKDDPNVGLCWDSGHEACYTHRDLLAEPGHGEKLIATHLNDNLGTRDFDGDRTGLDDLHLLPFDGIIDWQDVAERLNRWNYDDILMFELKPRTYPSRHESDAYSRMSPEEYVTNAYMRCCRVAAMFIRAKNALRGYAEAPLPGPSPKEPRSFRNEVGG